MHRYLGMWQVTWNHTFSRCDMHLNTCPKRPNSRFNLHLNPTQVHCTDSKLPRTAITPVFKFILSLTPAVPQEKSWLLVHDDICHFIYFSHAYICVFIHFQCLHLCLNSYMRFPAKKFLSPVMKLCLDTRSLIPQASHFQSDDPSILKNHHLAVLIIYPDFHWLCTATVLQHLQYM